MMPNLDKLNHLPAQQAKTEFLKCCGSRAWAESMTTQRPFGSKDDLLNFAERIWQNLDPKEWLEAMSHHAKIGVEGSNVQTLSSLAEWNRKYEDKFGHPFLICLTGKSAEEILSSIKIRFRNDTTGELQNSIVEALKITKLRLEKLLAG
jgi:OHCU decarboxylase